MIVLLLAAALPHGIQLQALEPDAVFLPEHGPQVAVLRTPGSGSTTVHVSVRFDETADEAGWGLYLRDLMEDELEATLSPIGARLEANRSRAGLTYSVSGPTAEFEHLAHGLREAMRPRAPDPLRLRRIIASRREAARLEAGTALGALRRELRAELGTAPALPSPPPSVSASRLEGFWHRTHRRSRIRIVVVGDVAPVVALAALKGIGSSHEGPAPPAQNPPGGPVPSSRSPRPSEASPQVLRHWIGLGFAAPEPRDPRTRVAAWLWLDALEAGGRIEATIEVRDLGEREVLIATGAAYPAGRGALRSLFSGLAEGISGSLTPATLERSVKRARLAFLMEARTPWGLAETVGDHWDASGDPAAASRFLERLDAIDPSAMARFLEGMERSLVRVEVNP